MVDHRPDGVRRRRGDPWSRRAGCPPPLAERRDGPHHHRADPGPAAVLRCLHGPAAGCRGRYRSAPPAAVRRAAAHDRCGRAACLPDVSRGRVGGGSVDRHHPGAHRRGAGAGGGHQQGRSGADPTSAECRERAQRWDRDAVCHPLHRRRSPPRKRSARRHGGWRRSSRSGWPSWPRSWSATSAGSCWPWPTTVAGPPRCPSRSPSSPWRCSPTKESVTVGGNGFIAAFAGGILFGAATRRRLAEPVQFTETLGLSGSFLVWSLFGALFVGELLTGDLAAQPIIYAVLSLTVIRMVPVAIALVGTRLRPATVAFMGWFGPRGLASVVFTLLALEEIEHSGGAGMLLRDRHLDHPAARWCCMASRPRRWLPGTGRRLPRRARSRRRRRQLSPRSGFMTLPDAMTTKAAAGTRHDLSGHRQQACGRSSGTPSDEVWCGMAATPQAARLRRS